MVVSNKAQEFGLSASVAAVLEVGCRRVGREAAFSVVLTRVGVELRREYGPEVASTVLAEMAKVVSDD